MHAKIPIILSILLGVIALAFSALYRSENLRNVTRSIVKEPESILASSNNRTNIALLGIGGTGHEGGELTDSLLIVSISQSSHQVTLLSLPRDIWLNSANIKLNAVYYYAEKAQKGSGLDAVQNALTEVTSLPIHYSLLLDFSGFIKAIDAVGGVDLVVDNTFDDYKYPIPGMENAEPESTRYEHLHFDAGPAHMDGVTALKYVRSRHALGSEGTDFARSLRQQKVIRAFTSSLISTKTVFNASRITTLKNTLRNSLVTNLSDDTIPALTKLSLTIKQDNITNLNIEELLYNPKNTSTYGGAWVLIPKTNWSDIHAYVSEKILN